jgi:hypothetical protein
LGTLTLFLPGFRLAEFSYGNLIIT